MKLANLIRGNDRGAITLRLVASVALTAAAGGAGSLAFVAPAGAAATSFTLAPITTSSGGQICDANDESPNYADVACDSAGNSAYFGSNGTLLGAAILLQDDPADAGVPGPVQSTTYVVQLGVGGVHKASIGVDGKGTNDTDYVYAGCAGAASPTYSKLASAAIADGSLTMVASGSVFKMTFNVPLSALSTCGITGATAMAPFVGTSQAGPLDNINKDFFLGNSVSFGSVNTAPVAVDDATTTPFNTPVLIAVLANDTDADGDTLTATGLTGPANGTLSAYGAGGVTYTPNAGFTGTDTFTYTASDGNGGSDTATVTVTVSAAGNTAPVAVDDATTTPFNTPVLIAVLANDTDADGDTLTATGLTGPANGTLSAYGAGGVTYTPNAGFTGTDTFTYTASDGNGGSDTATVTVTVSAAGNTAPVAVDDATTTPLNTPVLIAVLANDTDADGDTLTATGLTGPANGTLSAYGAGGVTYTPNAGFTGTDTFTYTASDGNGGSDTATVTVTVSAAGNTAPVAVDDATTTPLNTPVLIAVLANDTDADGDTLTATGLTGPANGTLSAYGAGGVTYTPNAGFTGTDTFTYTASDGNGGSDTATVTVTVSAAGNTAPVAVDDATTTPFNTPVLIAVLANDTDADGDTLTATGLTGPANGTLSAYGAGGVTYTPNAGFTGTDTFTYTVSDGKGGSDTGTVTITVQPQIVIVVPTNNAPNAVDDVRTTPFNTPVTVNVLGNDSDPDGDPLTVTQANDGLNGLVTAAVSETAALRVRGSLSLPTTGSLIYTPTAGFTGVDTFSYVISDGRGGTDSALVTVTVAGPVSSPTPDPSPSPSPSPTTSPIGGVTSPEPATSGTPSPSASPTTSALPSQLPFVDEEEPPAALPFTGSSTDQLLALGAGLSLLGLLLIVTGRHRRTVG